VDELAYGFTYRGRHCSEFGVNLLKYVIHPPELREYEEEISGLAGVIDYGTEFGKRQIDLVIDITPNSKPFKLRQSEIYTWLNPTLPAGPLVFDEMPNITYMAKLTSRIGIQQFNRYGTIELTMKCTDPFGREEATDTPTLKYDTGLLYDTGLMYPNETQFTISVPRLPMYMQNRGFEDAYPVITYTGSGSNPRLTINGKTAGSASTLAPGDVLVIDTLNGRITKNGALQTLTHSDFAPIPPGGCECFFEITGGTGTLTWDYNFLHL
jgi:predicted phage tail component-like protein